MGTGQSWSLDSIKDEAYRAKFVSIPKVISDWTGKYFELEGKDVLDFGCGEGTSAMGIALSYRARQVVGIEIQPEYERCWGLAKEQLGLESLPENLSLYRTEAGTKHDPDARFDLVYSWSVFEHVRQDQLGEVLSLMRSYLKPGGLIFAQVAPLFYSAEGSHFKPWVPEPWAHLKYQHSIFWDKLTKSVSDSKKMEELTYCYETLNRITADQLVDHFRAAGLEILEQYRTQDEVSVPPDLAAIYREEILRTNQIVLLARERTAASAPSEEEEPVKLPKGFHHAKLIRSKLRSLIREIGLTGVTKWKKMLFPTDK